MQRTRIKTILCAALLTAFLVFSVTALLCACAEPDQPYFGTYESTSGDDDIVIDASKFTWSGTPYDYKVENDTIVVDGTWITGAPLNFRIFENYKILSPGVVSVFDSGKITVRSGNISSMLINYSGFSIAEAYNFYIDGTFNYINTDDYYLMHSGTYTLKDGLLLMNGSTSLGREMKYSWYITEDYQIHYGVYVKGLDSFIPTESPTPEPESPEEPEEPAEVFYTLRYDAETGGSINGQTVQQVAEGCDGSAVTAVAGNGYEFIGWSDGITTAERTDTDVTADISVTAKFRQITEYTLTYTASKGGHIDGEVNQTVPRGGSGTMVTAVPDDGYEFVRWSDGYVSVPWRTDTEVYADRSATALFEKIPTYTLTYAAGDGGSIEGETTQIVNPGEHGSTVTAVPDDGYEFVRWSDGISVPWRTDTNVHSDISVTAQFKKIPIYTLTYSAGEGGSIEGNLNQTVNPGENGTMVTAVPDDGYEFIRWSDGISVPWRMDTNVYSNISVTAQFERIPTYTLTYSAEEGGHIEGEATQIVNPGEHGSTVIAVPDDGYEFVRWSDGISVPWRTDTNIYSDISVTAQFEKIPTYTSTTMPKKTDV